MTAGAAPSPEASKATVPEAALRVRRTDPRSDSAWEAFVNETPAATVYHHPLWLAVLEATYGHQPFGLLCEDDTGQVRGVLPLVRTHGLLTGRRLVSLPHTPIAGPLAADERSASALLRAAGQLSARPGQATLLIKAAPGQPRPVDAPEFSWRPWEESYILDLPERPEQLRLGSARNHARIRWAAGKAERAGVRVREAASESDVRAWYQLYLATMRHHAVPPRPLALFLAVWRVLRPAGKMRLLLAEQYGGHPPRLLAGSVFLCHNDSVFYAFNGRHADAFALRPNDVIQWRAIQDAVMAGHRVYDFGEVDPDQRGLAEFKSKWGAKPVRLYRLYAPAPAGVETAALGGESPLRRAAERGWQRLPLGVTAGLGSLFYRLA